jgi:hypothetical protein
MTAPLSTPPDCIDPACPGGAVTVQKTQHHEYDHRGALNPITFHAAIGACPHSLRHRIVRIDHTGGRTVVSEAVTAYATA